MSSYEQISVLPYPRELVWHALTRPELLGRWLSAKAPKIAPHAVFRIGGFGIGGGSARVTAIRSPREFRMALSWGGIETTVHVRLSEIVLGTRISIEHEGFEGPRAWVIKSRVDARAGKLLDRDLPTALEGMMGDRVLLERLEERRLQRETRSQERRDQAVSERDHAEDERRQQLETQLTQQANRQQQERDDQADVARLESEAQVKQQELERERMEAAIERARAGRETEEEEAAELERVQAAQAAKAAEERQAEQNQREIAERKAAEDDAKRRAQGERSSKRKRQAKAKRKSKEDRAQKRRQNRPDAEVESVEAVAAAPDVEAPSDLIPTPPAVDPEVSHDPAVDTKVHEPVAQAASPQAAAAFVTNEGPEDSVIWDEDYNRGAEDAVPQVTDENALPVVNAPSEQQSTPVVQRAPAQRVEREALQSEASRESEDEMRKRLFGELTGLLESARREALSEFRDRFSKAGIEFEEVQSMDLVQSEDRTPVTVERGEAVAELERRQEHERTEVRRMHDELDSKRRGVLSKREVDPGVSDQLESRLQQERRMLERLLRDRQRQERQHFENALDTRLTNLREAQDEAHRRAEEDRRVLVDERRRVEEERRQVEGERRRLAEDESRRRAEEIARESVRLELERSRFVERQSLPRLAKSDLRRPASSERPLEELSPREVAAEQRIRKARALRVEQRRREDEDERQASLKPEELARELRLRTAIEKADRASSKDGQEGGANATTAGSSELISELIPELPAKTLNPQSPQSDSDARSGGLGQRLSGFFGLKRGAETPGGDLPRPDRDGRVLTLRLNDMPGSTIDVDKYIVMRAAILAALPYDHRGVELKDLPDLVRPRLAEESYPRHVSITWYCVRVKWDLEARGLLEVVPRSVPERVRRISSSDIRKEA